MKGSQLKSKQTLFATAMVLMVLAFASIAIADSPKMDLKVGDEAYVCNCGPSCDCMTMSKKPGECVCGKPLVKAKVAYTEGDWAVMKIADGDGGFRLQAFKTVGKYACACDAGCDCNTISQKPGKCVCGREMKKVG